MPAGSKVAKHKHSIEMHVRVLRGSLNIIIGEPIDQTRARRFQAGESFVIPAGAWHDEWWDEDSVMEAVGVGPMDTTRAAPDSAALR